MERLEESGFAEWLEQALHGTGLEQPGAQRVVSLSGDEDDRDKPLPADQLVLKLRSRHPGHRDVEDEALGVTDAIGRKELVGGRERSSVEPEFPQQIGKRLAHRFVVVDD
jgi:hypothetical protein